MRKILVFLSCFVLLTGFLWGQTAPSGSGTIDAPYQITSESNLEWMAQQVNNGTNEFSGTYFEQQNDITLTAADFIPIGGNGTIYLFKGSYDGASKTISNLTINKPNTDNVGLFGHVGRGAVIQNLKLTGVDVKGARGTGSLIGRVTGDQTTLTFRCSSSGGSVVGDAAVGGLIGSHNSYSTSPSNRNEHPVLRECWATTSVSWSRKNAEAVKFGGLVGCNQKGMIYDSYAGGSVTVDNDDPVGSIVPERIGGLAGCILIRGLIENSFSYGQVTTTGSVDYVGGFVGGGGTGGANGNAYSCFYDVLDSGGSATNPSTTPAPTNSGDNSDITAETTANIESHNTFIAAGWDTTIWNLTENTTGSYPDLQDNPHSDPKTITVTDGSSFTPIVTQGTADNPIGRFAISADGTGSALTRATIQLVGTRTGASNFKLWYSSNDTFGDDTQKGSTVADDPGAGEYVSFPFDDDLTTTTSYYFLTCDVASDATGSIRAYLQDNSSLAFFDGELDSNITNAPLSGDDAPLPVTLSMFNANYLFGSPVLNWSTQSEIENMGWNIYRSLAQDPENKTLVNSEGVIPGAGTTSEPTYYSYKDQQHFQFNTVYWYWLESISISGNVELFGPLSFTTPYNDPSANNAPVAIEFGLYQNYPNPFNPSTEISFRMSEDSKVDLTIYDIHGRKIITLLQNEQIAAEQMRSVVWDGTDANGKSVSSGIYLYQLNSGKTTETRRMLLVK